MSKMGYEWMSRFGFLLLSIAYILCAGPVKAQTTPYNIITSYGALNDAVWGVTGCYFTTQTVANDSVKCANGTFTGATNTKDVIIDNGVTSSSIKIPGAPYVIQISSIEDPPTNSTILLSSSPGSSAAIYNFVSALNVVSGGLGYSFSTSMVSSAQVLQCSGCASVTGTPNIMTVSTTALPTVANAGSTTSAYVGSCTVTANQQTALSGAPTQFLVTIGSTGSGSYGITAAAAPAKGGFITADGGSYSSTAGSYAEQVIGCGLSGAVLNIKYVVIAEQVVWGTNAFLSPASPTNCTNGNTSTTNSLSGGSGLTLGCTVTFGTVSFGTDNTTAFQNAIMAMNTASSIGNPRCIYIPGGNYLVQPTRQGTGASGFAYSANGYGCWLGDEHFNSNVFVIPNIAGDAFAWNGSSASSSAQPFGNTFTFVGPQNMNKAGASFRNISVFGDRFSSAIQNGLAFYGATEWAFVDNCDVDYMRGYGLGAGLQNRSGSGRFVESKVMNCRFENDGDSTQGEAVGDTLTSIPAVLMTANAPTTVNGLAEGVNNVDFTNITFLDEWGPSMVFDGTATTTQSPSDLRLLNMKFEQSGMSQQIQFSSTGTQMPVIGNELQLGDPGSTGTGVSIVTCRNMKFTNSVTNYAALFVGTQSNNVECNGLINNTHASGGRGLQIDNCATCAFKITLSAPTDFGLTLGYSPTSNTCPAGSSNQAGPIIYDGGGTEDHLSTCLDPTAVAAGYVQFPVREMLVPPAASNAASGALPDLIQGLTSASTATLTVPSFSSSPPTGNSGKYLIWTYLRSGLSGPVSDAWDSASDLASNLGPAYSSGQTYHARVCNQTVYAETLTAGTGDTLSGIQTVKPGSCVPFTISVTGSGPYAAQIVGS